LALCEKLFFSAQRTHTYLAHFSAWLKLSPTHWKWYHSSQVSQPTICPW
jgi:hypothetical protein